MTSLPSWQPNAGIYSDPPLMMMVPCELFWNCHQSSRYQIFYGSSEKVLYSFINDSQIPSHLASYLEQYPPPQELPEDAAHWPHVYGVCVMLGAQQDLGGAVVLGDHLLGHVHSPVRLLHSEMEILHYWIISSVADRIDICLLLNPGRLCHHDLFDLSRPFLDDLIRRGLSYELSWKMSDENSASWMSFFGKYPTLLLINIIRLIKWTPDTFIVLIIW